MGSLPVALRGELGGFVQIGSSLWMGEPDDAYTISFRAGGCGLGLRLVHGTVGDRRVPGRVRRHHRDAYSLDPRQGLARCASQARRSLDRNATYIVATFVAGASR